MRGKFSTITDKGFGFITGEDGVEYFCHKSAFRGKWFSIMEEVKDGKEIKVEFKKGDDRKGARAEEVRLV
jgi:Cold shock proteins